MEIVEQTFKNSLQQIECGLSAESLSANDKEEETPYYDWLKTTDTNTGFIEPDAFFRKVE